MPEGCCYSVMVMLGVQCCRWWLRKMRRESQRAGSGDGVWGSPSRLRLRWCDCCWSVLVGGVPRESEVSVSGVSVKRWVQMMSDTPIPLSWTSGNVVWHHVLARAHSYREGIMMYEARVFLRSVEVIAKIHDTRRSHLLGLEDGGRLGPRPLANLARQCFAEKTHCLGSGCRRLSGGGLVGYQAHAHGRAVPGEGGPQNRPPRAAGALSVSRPVGSVAAEHK